MKPSTSFNSILGFILFIDPSLVGSYTTPLNKFKVVTTNNISSPRRTFHSPLPRTEVVTTKQNQAQSFHLGVNLQSSTSSNNEEEGKQGISAATFSLVKATVGSGVLALPGELLFSPLYHTIYSYTSSSITDHIIQLFLFQISL